MMPTLRDLRPSSRRGNRRANGSPARRRGHLVDCAVYVDGVRQTAICSPEEAHELARKADGRAFVWIGLHEPDEAELSGLAQRFGLHPLAVEDAVHAHQRPKLERYDDMIFGVFKTVRYAATDPACTGEIVETGEVMVFLGPDYVITVRHGEHGGLRALRLRLEKDPDALAKGPSAVLYAILDRIVDDYIYVAETMQDDVDAVESAVFSARRSRDAERIYLLKREVLELRRAVAPLAPPVRTLYDEDRPMPLIHDRIREYFRDIADHLARVIEQVAGYDELLTTIVQANLAQVTVAQNEDMRKISSWVAIFAVPTMIAGIYGMNFDHMPERHWTFGYPLVIGATALICYLLYRGFRRSGWL